MGKPKQIKYKHHYVRGTDDLVINTKVLENHKAKFFWVSKETGKRYRKNETECR